MSNFEDGLKTAIQHAGAWVLMELQKLQRGYTSLHPNEDLVQKGVELAHSEAEARGVPKGDVAVNPGHVIEAAQKIGASGADPIAVAADTKSPDATKADEPTMAVASTAHDPAPAGAVVEGDEAAIHQGGTVTTDSPTGEHKPIEPASPLTPPVSAPAGPPQPLTPDAA